MKIQNLIYMTCMSMILAGATAARAGAADCQTLEECRSKISQLEASIQDLRNVIAKNECLAEKKVSNGYFGGAYTFTKVSRPELGEGWRDPSGLVWFDRAPNTFDGYSASEYCAKRGSRLPTEQELEQLGHYMGASLSPEGLYSEKGFVPQVLPNLTGYKFWCSKEDYSNYTSMLDGSTGKIESGIYPGMDGGSVRCVVR